MKFVLSEELGNTILNYLGKRPYVEVADMINGLQRMTTLDKVIEKLLVQTPATPPVQPPATPPVQQSVPIVKQPTPSTQVPVDHSPVKPAATHPNPNLEIQQAINKQLPKSAEPGTPPPTNAEQPPIIMAPQEVTI